jgi:carbon storage regulator
MLVLSRKTSENVIIGAAGGITVKILSVKGNNVKLGFEAPENIAIDREEIFVRKSKDLKKLSVA